MVASPQAGGAEASATLARVHALTALEAAAQQAQGALARQAEERLQSHAAASTSAPGSSSSGGGAANREPAFALPSCGEGEAAEGWRRVLEHAELAARHAAAAAETHRPAELQPLLAELACVVGLHGASAVEQQLLLLLPGEQHPTTTGGGSRSSSALQRLLCPDALGQPSAELQAQAELLATAEPRSPASVLRRAALNSAAAEAAAAVGGQVEALYNAAEAHRLAASLFLPPADESGAGDDARAPSARGWWWRAAGEYAGALLQLGRLFEAAGLPDEAAQALREGAGVVSVATCGGDSARSNFAHRGCPPAP